MAHQFKVNPKVTRRVVKSVNSRVGLLKPGEFRTVAELCEPAVWASLSPAERKAAGRAVAAEVKKGALPILAGGRNRCNHQVYTMK